MYCCTPKALYNHVGGGSLLNHHQCAASTWMMRRQPQDNGASLLTTHQLQVERRESFWFLQTNKTSNSIWIWNNKFLDVFLGELIMIHVCLRTESETESQTYTNSETEIIAQVFALSDARYCNLCSEYTLARKQQHKQLWNTYLTVLENWHEY